VPTKPSKIFFFEPIDAKGEKIVAEKNDLGQVWTPQWMVELILNEAEFISADDSIVEKKILEPSFGEGIFLKEIVRRLVAAGHKQKISNVSLGDIINEAVHGVEYDACLFEATLSDLKKWCKNEFDLTVPFDNLTRADSLDYEKVGVFDYVVGNPPYVRIHNLPEEMRKKVKEYSLSTGTTDLYIIFYELGVKWLKEAGTLAYITPNSWMKNVSQKKFRKEIIDNKTLSKIINFGSVKVFENAATYTAVTVLKKSNQLNSFDFIEMNNESEKEFSLSIDFVYMADKNGAPFNFVSDEDFQALKKHNDQTGQTLGSVCKIQNGLATLGDKFFILKDGEMVDHESEFIVPIVKASKYKGEEIKGRIIFPYTKQKEKYVGVTEETLKIKDPVTHSHLIKNSDSLQKRSLDKNALWFWYGRSQAIQETGKQKLVFSHIIGADQKKITAHIVPAGTLVYSGLFITETGMFSLKQVKSIIESKEFINYCRLTGKDMSGGYKSVSAPLIKRYVLETEN
jgi:adenine-specific DNA-methyltransferase